MINRDLEQCDVFVGMLWKRWGTKPDHSGEYTSGFEEEFDRSIKKYEENGTPEICLFLKDIDSEFLRDPGDDLKKVLTFKENIINEKRFLYSTFSDIDDFRQKLDTWISKFIQRLAEEHETQPQRADAPPGQPDDTRRSHLPVSQEARNFLMALLSNSGGDGQDRPLTSAQVARLRLISGISGVSGNDDLVLGVHDANIIYINGNNVDFGLREINGLILSGLEHYSSENVPLWYWLKSRGSTGTNMLQWLSLGGGGRSVAALSAMRLISETVDNAPDFPRGKFVDEWLSEATETEVKIAALRYLGDCGRPEDVCSIRAEIDREPFATKETAIDALLRIHSRDSHEKAIASLLDLQPHSVKPDLLRKLLKDSAIDRETLYQCTRHSSAAVRRVAAELLRERKAISLDVAEQLKLDNDAAVRFEAVKTFVDQGWQLSDDEAKKILVTPKGGALWPLTIGFLFGGSESQTDKAGNLFWKQFLSYKLRKMNSNALKHLVGSGAGRVEPLLDKSVDFVLDERLFHRRGDQLRSAVGNTFKKEFVQIIQGLQEIGIDADLVEKVKNREDFIRKDFTRRGLDIICRRGNKTDIHLVRRLLKNGDLQNSDAEISFLGKFGEWDDIFLINAALEGKQKEGLFRLQIPTRDISMERKAAEAIYRLAHQRFEEVCSLALPHRLLSHLIVMSSYHVFAGLKDSSLKMLFQSDHDILRKAAALKSIQVFARSRLEKLLDNYVSADQQVYYNVIHWLDFGISLPRMRARAAARREIAWNWSEYSEDLS